MDIILQEISDKETWDNEVKRFPEATPCHSYDFIDIFSKSFELKKILLGIYKKDELIGIFPLFEEIKIFFKVWGSPLKSGISTLGPLVEEKYLEDTFIAFINLLIKNHVCYCSISFIKKINIESISKYSFSNKTCCTYVLKINDNIDELWNKLSCKCRNMIRKAQKNDIEIQILDKNENVDAKKLVTEYLKMENKMFKKAGRISPFNEKIYMHMYNILIKNGKAGFVVAKKNGQMIACLTFVFNNNNLLYFSTSSLDEFKNIGINDFLWWEGIRWACAKRIKNADMGGANIPSIAKFKEKFGGELKEYSIMTITKSCLFNLLILIYKKIVFPLKQKQIFCIKK